MHKQGLIDSVAEDLGITKHAAAESVNAVLRNLTYGLTQSETVRLPGFGTFVVKTRPARVGRNPRTGEPIQLAERYAVTFRPHKTLKEAVSA